MTGINEEYGLNVSKRLVRRRLNESKMYVSSKKPILSKKNIQYWKRILSNDETKINRIGPDGKTFVHREKNQEFNPRYNLKTVKHGGGNLKIWG